MITAAPPEIPELLVRQLNEGGRMILPVGTWYQELILLTKNKKGKLEKKHLIPVRFVPMTGQIQEKQEYTSSLSNRSMHRNSQYDL